MIELAAIADITSLSAPRPWPTAEINVVRSQYYKQHWCGPALLTIEGDESVDPFIFRGPDVTVVCRTDVLGHAHTGSITPAAYIATLYRHRGDEFTVDLRGTFAVILYDHSSHTLKAWTDHFGVEGLVYAQVSSFLGIATKISQLLSYFGDRFEIDSTSIHEYLQFSCIPTPKTIYKGISKLPAAHRLTCAGTYSIRPYWNITYPEESVQNRSETAWADETLDAVRSAVSMNLTGIDEIRRIGCFLSGGTDSSSVAGLVRQLTTQPPQTFSIGFDDPRYNEIYYARIAAKHFDSKHHEYFVTPRDILEVIQKAALSYDEPFGNSSVIPTYFCARLAAQSGITHLLAGDGGDELFGGNSRYADDRIFQKYSLIPHVIRNSCIEPSVSICSRWVGSAIFRRASSYIRRSNTKLPDRYFSYSFLSSAWAQDLFTKEFLVCLKDNDPLAPARRHYFDAVAESELNRWLYLDLKITITDNDLRKVTTMCRLAEVQPRYPLLDWPLAAFAATIPAYLKVRGSRLRYMFKKAMRAVL